MLRERRLGLVEDDAVMGEALVECFRQEGATVEWWNRGKLALAGIAHFRPELVVCDIRLPDLSGQQLFSRIREDFPETPFLFITAFGRIDEAVRLMQQGAGDYVTKPFDVAEFLNRISRLLPMRGEPGLPSLGPSPAMREIEATIRRVAGIRSTVLLAGETGVGKEVCARLLHDLGRSEHPFVPVNCAAIPTELLESEMFGHERGAFTGAGTRHLGHAERAGEGTLFLDEISELVPAMQAKLLRLLDDRQFYRVGGSSLLPFKARVVAATNVDLASCVESGRFRQDLFFRLSVIPVTVPPLRQRPEDVLWLLNYFFEKFRVELGSSACELDASVAEAALAHDWPGNVRELKNRLEKAMALSGSRRLVASELFSGNGATPADLRLKAGLRDAERRQIERALALTDGEIMPAAKALGISRTTLWKKMRALEFRGSKPA
jgi:DNA-binding NtrC family response regulator